MVDDKKIETAKEEIYEDRFLLNGEEIVFNNDEKEEMFYEGDIKEAIGLGAKWAIILDLIMILLAGSMLMIYYQRREANMIKPVTMYSVICDRCGKTFIDEFNGIVAWLDEGTAKEQAMESEWAEIGNKHYCPDCYEFDDELDEYVPKKKGGSNERA